MHLIANTIQAEKVKAVYIWHGNEEQPDKSGWRRVDQPFELDTEEGWVDAYVPKTFGGVQYQAGGEVKDLNEAPNWNYELVRMHGQIKVEFWGEEDE